LSLSGQVESSKETSIIGAVDFIIATNRFAKLMTLSSQSERRELVSIHGPEVVQIKQGSRGKVLDL